MRHDTSRAAGRPSPSSSMRPTSKSPTAAETRDFFSSLLTGARLLLRGDAGRLDDLAVACDLARDEMPELVGRHRFDDDAELVEDVVHLRLGQGLPGFRIQTLDDALRRAGRRE